jgi:hypothetical protein
MQIELRLIGLYSFIEDCYNKELQWYCQRFSRNGLSGDFTDIELLTCYFYAILEEEKYQVKQIYNYMSKYWLDWFPDLPSYQAFNNRLNRLDEALPLLLGILSAQLRPVDGFYTKDLLLDSLPIILCKGKRNGKVASQMAAKTYSASKGIYYYGLKLHWMGMSQAGRLPLPVWMELTSAAAHDLPSLKGILPHLWHCNLFADKAYASDLVAKQLEKQDAKLYCPEKNKKGESIWERAFNQAFRKLYGRAVSSVRQPIEAFFNWIIEKVAIQNATKVRSVKGLKVHVFGKAAAAMMILIGF